MEPFRRHTGTAVPLRVGSVDTDQIIPARWLKRISRHGFEDGLFEAWRADPDFVLHRPERQGASILLAGPDFGIGSSREHAVWALQDYGFHVVVSPRFADIFAGNALNNGLLVATVSDDVAEALWRVAETDPTARLTVDLETCRISAPGAGEYPFEIAPEARTRLLLGADAISTTLAHAHALAAFEVQRPVWRPVTVPPTDRLAVAAIPGDGIGPEVTEQALAVLRAALPAHVALEVEEFDFGARHHRRTGRDRLTSTELDRLAGHDAILLGAVGDPSVASGVLERGTLLRIRFALDHFVNLRPSRTPPGGTTAEEIDLVVVREGTEGAYTGSGGVLRPDSPQAVALEVSVNTAFGVERVVREAFRLAGTRTRRKVTLVHKNNVLVHAGTLWTSVFEEVAAEFEGIETEYVHVDAACMYLVSDPTRFDVVVTDNLFGDILTDVAAAVTGGLGLAASGSIDATRAHPALFEPVHGSAPDIAGRDLADPTAAVLSVALMLRHLGRRVEADVVEEAVRQDLAARPGPRQGTCRIGADLVARVGDVHAAALRASRGWAAAGPAARPGTTVADVVRHDSTAIS